MWHNLSITEMVEKYKRTYAIWQIKREIILIKESKIIVGTYDIRRITN